MMFVKLRRGTPFSRLLAGLVAAIPVAGLIAAISFGALYIWDSQSERYKSEQLALRRIAAEAEQARLYEPLREAWRDYSRTDLSGLSQAPSMAAAQSEIRSRLAELFGRYRGEWSATEVLAPQLEPGLERLRVETRGLLPEAELSAFLEALESETPFLFVDLFDARRTTELDGRPALELRLQVSAYRLSEPET